MTWLKNKNGKMIEFDEATEKEKIKKHLEEFGFEIVDNNQYKKGINTIKNPIANKKIAVIEENCSFYSGGRYNGYQFLCALAELGELMGFDVEYWSNKEPIFKNDFSLYKNINVNIVDDFKRHFDVLADLYISFPTFGNERAIELAEKYNKPVMCYIFDALPYIKKCVPEDYAMEREYMQSMADKITSFKGDIKILTVSELTRDYSYKWLKKDKKDFEVIYPVVNSRVLHSVPDYDRKDWVVYVGRFVNRKNFKESFKAFSKLPDKWRLQIITSYAYQGDLEKLLAEMRIKDRVDVHFGASDYEKFTIMKKSKMMINSSKFEGFGMWLIEAMACGIPVVFYEYPTAKEIIEKHPEAENYFKMAKFGDYEDFERIVKKVSKMRKKLPLNDDFDFSRIKKTIRDLVIKWLA